MNSFADGGNGLVGPVKSGNPTGAKSLAGIGMSMGSGGNIGDTYGTTGCTTFLVAFIPPGGPIFLKSKFISGYIGISSMLLMSFRPMLSKLLNAGGWMTGALLTGLATVGDGMGITGGIKKSFFG